MKEELLDKLYDSFELKIREGLGGMQFKYVPSNDIIDRMNRIFRGCWSTEVTAQERMDDFVVVRVRVSAYDEDSERQFSHDGYGSSSIMRYTGGQKKGQIIDLGNAYKSAEAKAIKNACSRWGVGLYLEEASEEEGGPFKAPTGGVPKSSSTNTQPTLDITPPPFPEDNSSLPGAFPSMPEVSQAAGSKRENRSSVVEVPPTPPAEEPPVPATPPTPSDSTRGATGPQRITDVQRVAIQGLLQIKSALFADVPENERFGKLATDALGRTDNLPKKPEDLSYQDAVTVIKYGNDIDKR